LVGSSNDLNIIVQLDRANDLKTRRFYITQGGGYKKDCIEIFGETNTGDPKVLEDFIMWGMEKYPAKRYALVVWNHGGGWWDEPERNKRNIAYDDSSGGDSINNQELQEVLNNFYQVRGDRIDLFGMDACLMAMVEVAYQIRDSVKITVGSEIEEPFNGWPYDVVLQVFKNRPRLGTATFAKEIVKAYVKSYQGAGEDATQSAVNLFRIGDVVSKLDTLAQALIAGIADEGVMNVITKARDGSPQFFSNNYVDLYRFAQLLETKCTQESIKNAATDLLAVLKPGGDRAIIHQLHLGSSVKNAHGMSIYFPNYDLNPKYNDLDFCRDCRWGEFLKLYLGSSRRCAKMNDQS
jgi:hypothetical protein